MPEAWQFLHVSLPQGLKGPTPVVCQVRAAQATELVRVEVVRPVHRFLPLRGRGGEGLGPVAMLEELVSLRLRPLWEAPLPQLQTGLALLHLSLHGAGHPHRRFQVLGNRRLRQVRMLCPLNSWVKIS